MLNAQILKALARPMNELLSAELSAACVVCAMGPPEAELEVDVVEPP